MNAPYAIDVSTADFAEQVVARSQHTPVIVDFWAPWCQPCRVLKPLLEKLAAEYAGRFILAKVNSDENQEIAAHLGVRGIPAVKAFVGGEVVDEFTGALPEAQVREFIERIIPSPAEPLRLEAQALAAHGDLEGARALLAEAIHLDPRNDNSYLDYIETSLAVGDIEAAREVLDSVGDRARDATRVTALRARLNLAASGVATDLSALQAELAAQPDNLDLRLQLANAQALNSDYRAALENLLEIVRRDRKWNEEAGRKGMLNLFSMLAEPQHDALVREFRVALARTLN